LVAGHDIITANIVQTTTDKLGIDSCGLDGLDLNYIRFIADKYRGGPVGIETIAAALSEDKGTIEEIIEPFLLKEGFVEKTPRGRILTEMALRHIGIA
jgi:Holliday junction DNA helicase RuvB